jgi:peptidoglycan/LPS O-acetylase OafA/YrhL
MSISQNVGADTAPVSTRVASPSVTALRWYMRIAAGLMVLFMALPGDPSSSTLFTFIANHAPFIIPALAALIGSFEKRANWLLGVVLALMWAVLAIIFVFGGPNGPGLVFEIAGTVLVGAGLVIAALSFRAYASDF